ncbi:WD40-repeat-containing domain protein [Phascolomyces articulosus]|uniref:WD40-repeat-containing domain protein n=1 Tax=Phascolomyces articulosus TaxID=60185 RepID=A0AAD5JYL7_9FUNG|nr:WD40-repeat-containing domain protein [Phascolomyces articulosus]
MNSIRKSSNRPNSTGSTNSGRMQRIVSQATARLSSDTMNSEPDYHGGGSGHDGLVRYRLHGPLTSIAISPEKEAVAVAGREVLKILAVNPSQVREVLNLRAGSHLSTNYNSNDVKWGNNATKSKLATASNNGAIILWDINRTTGRRAERVINEHSRAVNRVCFQPDNGNILLSASQDGTMKCWDLRDPKLASRYRFEGKSESVRDVQFNPVHQHEFAAAFEMGTIQKWDMRNPKALYDRKFSAHNGPCLTVDWHPSGRFVASGGRDKTIKVWDMSVDSRRPMYTIRTMASVSRIQWRPGYEHEITSCALLTDNRIHVWDIRRPHIAKYAFDFHDQPPTGCEWLNSDVLYSCGKDKTFVRQEIHQAYQPVTVLRRNGMGWNIQGDLAFTVDRSARDSFVDESLVPTKPTSTQSKKWKKGTSKLSIEDEFIQYVPPQSCGISHLPMFDFEAFSLFAEHYDISGDDVLDSCEKNSDVAFKLGRYRTAQTWKIIALLFQPGDTEDEDEEEDDEGQDGNKEGSQHQQQSKQLSLLLQEDESSESESTSSEEEEDEEGTENSIEESETESSAVFSEDMSQLWSTWQHQGVVNDLMDYYTEEGDVQMCVTLYLVLRHHIQVNADRLEDWFAAYIDLLHRFKLWTTATAVINACPIVRIRERNENATTINIACNNCFKLVMGTPQGAWACDKCHRLLNPCSICHQTVRGLYVWCQGCNHGGHLEHMREWFNSENKCPTGCGHSCTLPSLVTLGSPPASKQTIQHITNAMATL